jgi:predicted transcriptional regulator
MDNSQTSLMAFEQIKPELSRLQALVYAAVASRQGSTDNDLERLTGLKGSTLRPRRVELQREGWIKQRGAVRQENGRIATVWVVT